MALNQDSIIKIHVFIKNSVFLLKNMLSIVLTKVNKKILTSLQSILIQKQWKILHKVFTIFLLWSWGYKSIIVKVRWRIQNYIYKLKISTVNNYSDIKARLYNQEHIFVKIWIQSRRTLLSNQLLKQ